MPRRYDERGFDRYGERDDDTLGGRETGRGMGRGYEQERNRYGRSSDYGALSRGLGAGRDYEERGGGGYGEYSRGGDYGRGPSDYERGYGQREHARDLMREYPPRYGREGAFGGAQGRAYERDYGRDYGRDYVRGRERDDDDDDNRIRSFDTDYGRTTSRFYGRSGYEYGRDDYDPYGDRDRDERGTRVRDRRDRGWWDRAADEVLSWFGDDDAVRRRRMDGSGEGRYRGLGPKNYRRPDERIREEINDRLTDNDWLDASEVEVFVAGGEVTLTGDVDSRYAKRLAEDIAASVTGVMNVQNNLRVQTRHTEPPLAAGDAATPGVLGTVGATETTPGLTTGATLDAPSSPDDEPPSGRASRAAGR